jgi:hypothetical protein
MGQANNSDENTGELDETLVMDDNNAEDGASFENLIQSTRQPINLNTAREEELRFLSVLSSEQIHNVLQHRKENGNFISAFELQTVEQMDSITIRRLAPLVFVRPPSEVIDKNLLRRIRREGENYFMILTAFPMEKKAGFTEGKEDNDKFQGSRERVVTRYRTFRPGDFSAGFTCEKDEGERLRWDPGKHSYGFDHVSFHIQLQNKGKIKNFIAGDFQCQFGQGLIWGGGLGISKGAETISTTRKASIGCVPYTSAYEAGYFRGLTTTLQLHKRVMLTGIFSTVHRDGSLREQDGEPTLTSLSSTGLHRNDAELEKRMTTRETISGGVIQYSLKNLETGISIQHLAYNAPLEKSPKPYNQFSFEGESNTNSGIFLNYNFLHITFFSEFAQSTGHGKGYVAGLLIPLTKKFEVSVVHRNYDRNYYPFYNSAFSENTLTQNERGIYWGWRYKFNRRYTWTGYLDTFEFPWLKFRTYAPSRGFESLTRLSWQPSKSTTLFLQGRIENKMRNTPGDRTLYKVEKLTKYNLWLNLDYVVAPSLRMKTRLQASEVRFNHSRTSGFLLLHDVTFSFYKLKCTGRYALFDTDDFDNRHYAYEHDVWMSYSLPSYYGKGTRKYFLVQYKFNRALTFWAKYSQTRYLDRDSIGSGADEIHGNIRNEIKFEMRIKF